MVNNMYAEHCIINEHDLVNKLNQGWEIISNYYQKHDSDQGSHQSLMGSSIRIPVIMSNHTPMFVMGRTSEKKVLYGGTNANS